MMRLFHHPMSAGSRYARLLLGEYARQVELAEEKPWLRREEFLSLNPSGQIPVLVEGSETVVCGAIVIGEYLDETIGAMQRERRLMPENSAARAEARRLVEWFLVKFDQEVTRHLTGERVFKQLMRSEEGGGPPDPSIIRAARANLKAHMGYLAGLAANRDWLAGDVMSGADLAAAASVSVLDYLGEISWDEQPAAREWFARVKSRPSYRPLLADKVLGLPPAAHYIDLDF